MANIKYKITDIWLKSKPCEIWHLYSSTDEVFSW